jgi:hypothetical protein
VTGKAQILPDTLDLFVLKPASLGPLHGYGILLRIAQISARALLIEQGALYPALFRLLTSAGRKRLREEEDEWDRLAAAMACALAAQPEEI